MTTRALVLGGGGLAGIAWETGLSNRAGSRLAADTEIVTDSPALICLPPSSTGRPPGTHR